MRRWVLLSVLVLTALTMGLEFAHVLEWPQKSGYPGALYVRLQESLYVWFGNIGAVIYVLAVAGSVVLAVLVRRDRVERWWFGAAAAAQVVALAGFLTVIYPVNLRLPISGAGAVPADWAALRDRWEFGHATGFVLFAVSFLVVLVRVVRRAGSGVDRGDAVAVSAG